LKVTRFGGVRQGKVGPGKDWQGLVRFGLAWPGSVWRWENEISRESERSKALSAASTTQRPRRI